MQVLVDDYFPFTHEYAFARSRRKDQVRPSLRQPRQWVPGVGGVNQAFEHFFVIMPA